MFIDLNILLPTPALVNALSGQSKKKGKQKQQSYTSSTDNASPIVVFSPNQIVAIEARIDLLVHVGYTVIALNQTVQSKVDSRTHVDWLQDLVPKLKKRRGIAILKRLSVILDEESDKGNGINAQNATLLSNYDILSVHPTTQNSFSSACLTHSVPSPQTTHIISVPVISPRLPFHLKHTLIRTALKNGAVFEIAYAGAVGAESERRCWWGGARELVRVTKGKGILLSGGTNEDKEVRAPRDVANLVTLLGIPQNLSHEAITQTAKSVILRAQSRKTYRAVLSEPKLIIPSVNLSETLQTDDAEVVQPSPQPESALTQSGLSSSLLSPASELPHSTASETPVTIQNERPVSVTSDPQRQLQQSAAEEGKKRRREDTGHTNKQQSPKKKKKKA